jgi:uncharacterized protein YbjQ (UPF0145 family)
MLVVTTEGIPGYTVQAVKGEVVGLITRTLNPYAGGVVSLNGVGNPELCQMLKHFRQQAVDDMTEAARRLGANAVVAMRFDHRPITPSTHELCAYGTAVVAVPAQVPELAAA